MAIVIEDHNCGEWPSPRLSVCISECRRFHSSGIPVCFHTHMYTRNRHDAWFAWRLVNLIRQNLSNRTRRHLRLEAQYMSCMHMRTHIFSDFCICMYMFTTYINIHVPVGPHSELCRSGNVEVAGLAYCSRELCIPLRHKWDSTMFIAYIVWYPWYAWGPHMMRLSFQ